jgi:IS1 family transposase
MNKLETGKQARILHCLCEGNSIRATARLNDVAINTVVKLLCAAGKACSDYQDKVLRNLSCRRLQTDEAWSFCYAKEKDCTPEMKAKGAGDVWTWAAIDADTKLIPCWFIGTRDAGAAYHFMHDLAARLSHRVQLTTDGHRAYLSAVEDAFGAQIDYAMLQEIYGNSEQGPETRYSPAICMGARKAVISGFSKKLENHEHSVALHFMHYNFCRIHQSLRVTPATEAGVSDHVWSLEEIVSLLDLSLNRRGV